MQRTELTMISFCALSHVGTAHVYELCVHLVTKLEDSAKPAETVGCCVKSIRIQTIQTGRSLECSFHYE
jgi:hypothetical protein